MIKHKEVKLRASSMVTIVHHPMTLDQHDGPAEAKRDSYDAVKARNQLGCFRTKSEFGIMSCKCCISTH